MADAGVSIEMSIGNFHDLPPRPTTQAESILLPYEKRPNTTCCIAWRSTCARKRGFRPFRPLPVCRDDDVVYGKTVLA